MMLTCTTEPAATAAAPAYGMPTQHQNQCLGMAEEIIHAAGVMPVYSPT